MSWDTEEMVVWVFPLHLEWRQLVKENTWELSWQMARKSKENEKPRRSCILSNLGRPHICQRSLPCHFCEQGRTWNSVRVLSDPPTIYPPFLFFSYHLSKREKKKKQKEESNKTLEKAALTFGLPLIWVWGGGCLERSGCRDKMP